MCDRMDAKDKFELADSPNILESEASAPQEPPSASIEACAVASDSRDASVVSDEPAAGAEAKPALTMGMTMAGWVHEAPWPVEELQISCSVMVDSDDEEPWYLCGEDYYIGAMKLDKLEDGTFGLRAARVFMKPGAQTAVFNCYDPNGMEIANMRGSPRITWYDDEDVDRKEPQTANLNLADMIVSFPSPEAFHLQNIGEDIAVVDFAFLSITAAEYALVLEMKKMLTLSKRRGA